MKRVHFIGVGGIGVSALARYFLSEGWRASGSDLFISDLTEDLEREGLSFYKGHQASNIRPEINLVIYSAAVQSDNPELQTARGMRIKIQSYAQALGALTKKYFTIAVSGSHGKSTTTALLSLLLVEAGLDPTVIVGTKLREFSPVGRRVGNSNFRKGKSNYLVIEADEWNKSFHYYFPKLAVITNIDNEHLDTYKNFRGVVAGFAQYLKNMKKKGTLVANYGDASIRVLAKKTEKRGVEVVFYNRGRFKKHPLSIPGKFNQINAEAAWTAFKVISAQSNIPEDKSKKIAKRVFQSYHGSWRRMERLEIKTQGIVYSDYAHHPTEIKATLQALHEKFPRKRLVCVFEPHQEDRLMQLFDDFAKSFTFADKVVFLPAYKVAGREERARSPGDKDVFALAQEVGRRKQQTFYASRFEEAVKLVRLDMDAGAVVVFMGAGVIDANVREFFCL